jgi:hypothetical protein
MRGPGVGDRIDYLGETFKNAGRSSIPETAEGLGSP